MTSAIIVAAGKGTRMGPGIDKLFLEISGCPVVGHTWRRFDEASCIDELIVVLRSGLQSTFEQLKQKLAFNKSCKFVEGGKERQDSVWNGLAAVSSKTTMVAIHDAARPCTSQRAIQATLQAATECGAAVAAQPVTDTVKESSDGKLVLRTLDRTRLWTVQTPQCFRLEIIKKALAEVRRRQVLVTDDAAACELLGQPVRLVACTEPNPKVTRPEDLPVVASILERLTRTESAALRTTLQ